MRKKLNLYGFDEETYHSVEDQITEFNLKHSYILTFAMCAFMALCLVLSLVGALSQTLPYVTMYAGTLFLGLLILAVFHWMPYLKEKYPRKINYVAAAYVLLFGVPASMVDTHIVATMYLVDLILIAIMYVDRFYHVSMLLLLADAILMATSFGMKPAKFAFMDLTNVALFTAVAISMHYVVSKERIHAYLAYADLQESRHQLETEATFDKLTGLLYRGKFFPLLEELMAKGDRTFAFGILDLDDFKSINDNYGHQAGDKALKSLAETIKNTLDIKVDKPWEYTQELMDNQDNFAGRLGGDEFIFLIRQDTREASVNAVVERLQRNVQEIEIAEGESLTISVGVALADPEAKSVDGLYRLADRALYHAKEGGKAQSVYIRSGDRKLDEEAV